MKSATFHLDTSADVQWVTIDVGGWETCPEILRRLRLNMGLGKRCEVCLRVRRSPVVSFLTSNHLSPHLRPPCFLHPINTTTSDPPGGRFETWGSCLITITSFLVNSLFYKICCFNEHGSVWCTKWAPFGHTGRAKDFS